MPLFEGNLFTQWHQITSLETRDSRLSYSEDPESLSDLALNPYRVVTDRRTDRIPIANTRSQQYLPAQLSRVKTWRWRNVAHCVWTRCTADAQHDKSDFRATRETASNCVLVLAAATCELQRHSDLSALPTKHYDQTTRHRHIHRPSSDQTLL